MKKHLYVKIPQWWFLTAKFTKLKPVDRLFLLFLWNNTKDGRVPETADEAAFLAGIGHNQKPQRITQALQNLHNEGFLQRDSEGYFFDEFWQIMRRKGATFSKRGGKIPAKNTQKQAVAGESSRARLLSLSEREKETIIQPLSRGGVDDVSQKEWERRAEEIKRLVKNEKQS